MWTIPLSILMPCIVATQPTRLLASLAAFAYYAAASVPLVATAKMYWPAIGAAALLVWVLAAMVLTVPWTVCWTWSASLRPFGAAAALVASAVPPLCIVGWASPLMSAGVLFPGSGFIGLLGTAAMPSLLLCRSMRWTTALIGIAAAPLLNILTAPPPVPSGWAASGTAVRRPSAPEPEAEFQIEEQMQSVVHGSPARYLVFPEGTVHIWTEATDLNWAPVLADSGKTILAGASLPTNHSGYNNALVICDGQRRRAIIQRIPIPGGMWNPTSPSNSFAVHLFGSGIADVGGQRVAALICYEQLLVWPMIWSAIERPTLLIAVANDAWTSNTSIPATQQACVRAWARLFGLPVLSAINS